jgi:hypothetical protein
MIMNVQFTKTQKTFYQLAEYHCFDKRHYTVEADTVFCTVVLRKAS